MRKKAEPKKEEAEGEDNDVELLSHLNKKKLSIIEEKFPEEGEAW